MIDEFKKLRGIIGSLFGLGPDGPNLKATDATTVAVRSNDDTANVKFVATDLSSDTTHAVGNFVEYFDGEATQVRTVSTTQQLLLTDREVLLDTSGIDVTMPNAGTKAAVILITNRAGGKVNLIGNGSDTVDESVIRNGESFRMRFDKVSHWSVVG